ncbi:hypothetical protein NIES3787_05570 [Microcystis aeruginosa NIES-3787]|jgi:hypothetical protein|uniref:Uncharacterized protein n=2 Tax=Microcystis aeruginosa TaxID=1126 RepID=A0A6H9G3Z1_MICAE|nr:hypothetical protein OA58_04025 [Microcystis aeruginosa NIES-88]BCU12916.1 hypothetical protein MAN88_34800 [Microcystis aeruginosa]GCL44879.1 hypothetical protein NIES3787_05570 [Microcystis aeruginosa NIES-3787]
MFLIAGTITECANGFEDFVGLSLLIMLLLYNIRGILFIPLLIKSICKMFSKPFPKLWLAVIVVMVIIAIFCLHSGIISDADKFPFVVTMVIASYVVITFSSPGSLSTWIFNFGFLVSGIPFYTIISTFMIGVILAGAGLCTENLVTRTVSITYDDKISNVIFAISITSFNITLITTLLEPLYTTKFIWLLFPWVIFTGMGPWEGIDFDKIEKERERERDREKNKRLIYKEEYIYSIYRYHMSEHEYIEKRISGWKPDKYPDD